VGDDKVTVEPTLQLGRAGGDDGRYDEVFGEGTDPQGLPTLEEAMPLAMEERFALGVRIGHGGMGEVFTAKDSLLNRRLAVKVLTDLDPKREGLPRFLREAQVTAQLSHPNVVPVYGLERSNAGRPALSMKLIQGRTFAEYVRDCTAARDADTLDPGTQGLSVRVDHFLKVCDAMAYAHSRGVLHRDLKPGNLMLGPFGEVYVMDWGIARVEGAPDLDPRDTGAWAALAADAVDTPPTPAQLEGAVDVTNTLGGADAVTRDGDVLGTLSYMPPEQADGRPEAIGPAADQFALGMILFELACLDRARWSSDESIRYEMAFAGHRRSYEDVGADLPRELRAVIDKATSPAAAARYDDVAAFAADLRRFQRGAEVLADPDDLPRKLWRKLRNRPLVVVATVLSALLLAAGAVVASLAHSLDVERAEAARRQHLADLVSTVSSQVQTFDRDLARVEVVLEGLGVATRDLLAHGVVPEDLPPRYQPRDLLEGRGPPDTARVPRYKQLVTMESTIVLPPLGKTFADIAEEQAKLAPLDSAFRTAMLRTAGDELAALRGAAATARLHEGVPLMWAYIGLADGTLINFPGNAQYPADYDVLARPWFTETIGTHGPQWGALYPDASGSGFLLPCNVAILDRDGDFLGVAGADLAMDRVIEEMSVPGLTGVRESMLLDGDGSVLVSSTERGVASELSIQDNRTKEKRSLDSPRLERQVRAGRTSGFVHAGDDLYVFSRLKAVPWVLTVRLDAAAHGLDVD